MAPRCWSASARWSRSGSAARAERPNVGGLLQSAHWPFLIDVYFFLGGLAGGAFVIATAALIVDSARYRDVSRVGYYLALVALVPCPVILIVDLGVPVRFMNMVMTFNPRSP
ncbi:MAG: polysulfide reductase, partial [Candidatus Rokuibacteriota bacterium]